LAIAPKEDRKEYNRDKVLNIINKIQPDF